MAIALGSAAKKLRLGSATPSRLYAGSTAFWDADAAAYTAAVEAADGQSLELGVVAAYHNFILGCKADGIWDAIKASSILCGARTLAGALVPLVGTAPTNVADGFVSGDYTRGGATPGLKGDGTSYLDSGRANDDDPQNDFHAAAYLTTTLDAYVAAAGPTPAIMTLAVSGVRNRSATAINFASSLSAPGLVGSSRASSDTVDVISNGVKTSASNTSSAPGSQSILLFGYVHQGLFSQNTIAFYSIGESLDLEALDARVTALVTAIGAAV